MQGTWSDCSSLIPLDAPPSPLRFPEPHWPEIYSETAPVATIPRLLLQCGGVGCAVIGADGSDEPLVDRKYGTMRGKILEEGCESRHAGVVGADIQCQGCRQRQGAQALLFKLKQ